MNWIVTSTGRPLRLDTPVTSLCNLSVGEMAHALANINRFAGHALRPISVAEHSLLVWQIVDREMGLGVHAQLAALMHDAHECVVGDVSSPVKAQLGQPWRSFEHEWESALHRVHALTGAFEVYSGAIKRADLIALATERRDLLPPGGPEWEVLKGVAPLAHTNLRERDRFTWQDWRDAWLDTYHQLDYARNLRHAGSTSTPTNYGGTA